MKPPALRMIQPVQLAAQGSFAKIDWDKLKPKDITQCDHKGLTLLHHTAAAGLWPNLPEKLRDKKYWTKTPNGSTIYMLAIQRPSPQQWINSADLTEEEILRKDNLGESFLSLGIATPFLDILKLIPKVSITQRVLTENYGKYGISGNYEDKMIHAIAKKNQVQHLAKEHLKEEILCLKGDGGLTVYHILAGIGRLKDLPKKLLTKEALTQKNDQGNTPLLAMAAYEPHLIPKELLTPQYMLQQQGRLETQECNTPLHTLINEDNWMHIPEDLITKESLKIKAPNSLLSLVISQYDTKRVWHSEDKTKNKKMHEIFSRAIRLGDTISLKRIKKGILKKEETFTKPHDLKWVSTLIQDELTKRKLLELINKKEAYMEI